MTKIYPPVVPSRLADHRNQAFASGDPHKVSSAIGQALNGLNRAQIAKRQDCSAQLFTAPSAGVVHWTVERINIAMARRSVLRRLRRNREGGQELANWIIPPWSGAPLWSAMGPGCVKTPSML